MFVNYEGSILSYIASIRRYFGLESSYGSNPRLSRILEEQRPAKVFVLLVDGMGTSLIRRVLPEDSFLRENMLASVTTVFPTTTTAATTSIRNGRAPCENAWLGWTQYLKEVEDIIIPFRSSGYYNDIPYEEGIFGRYIPVSSTENDLNEAGIAARVLFPAFMEDGCEDFDEMCERLSDLSYNSEYRYIYAYWDMYDTYMHMYGPSSKICDFYLININYLLEELAANLNEDTILIVTADHGQIDVKRFYNLCHSPFEKFFVRKPALEQRAMALYIREGMKEEFEKNFKAAFENDYVLLSKDQVLRSKLFGDRPNHPRFEEFIGDYLAIAKSDMILIYREQDDAHAYGQHAGICDEELMIPVIAYRRGKKIIQAESENT